MKLPRSIRLVDPAARPRFFREAQALARLNHPHIVPVYEAGEHDGTCYLAVAYCNGPTLDAWRRQQEVPVNPLTAAQILLILAEAVEHAHQQGILHRDIKPTNVLLSSVPSPGARLTPDRTAANSGSLDFSLWAPKLTDFGLAKMADDQRSSSTISGTVLGTPDYLSPEQAAGMVDKIGPPTDVYGLGAVLYELLTGQPPIHGASTADTLRRVLVDEPRSLRDLVPSVPRDLEAIAIKCLQKSTRLRYQSAFELHADLQRFLDGQKVVAPSVKASIFGPWPQNSWAVVRKFAFPAALAALCGVALAALLVVRPKTPDATLVGDVRSPSSSSTSIPQSQNRKSEIETQKPAPNPIPPPPGLVAWWSGDGHARDLVGKHHGTMNGGVTFAPGAVGQAFSFDGIDDLIRVRSSEALNPRGGFTIECWICCKPELRWQNIISKWSFARNDFSFSLQKAGDSGRASFALSETGRDDSRFDLAHFSSKAAITPETWVHVAATFDTHIARLFLDGAEDGSQSFEGQRYIHRGSADVDIGTQQFAGLIDELCLYDRALASDEIEAIYRAGSAGKIKPARADKTERPVSSAPISPAPILVPPGLVAWWSGDGHARDYAGKNHGIPLQGATFAPGLVGKAFSLDGIDDTIRVPNSDALNPTTGFTFECWIYPKSTAGWQKLISKWGDPDASYSFQKTNDTDLLTFHLTESPPVRGNLLNLESESRVVPFQWAHVAATYDNNVARIYFNGALDAEVSVGPDHPIHVSKTDVLLGSNHGHCFCGLMDEVCLYDRALTSAEIEAIYRAGTAGKIKPIVIEQARRPASTAADSHVVIASPEIPSQKPPLEPIAPPAGLVAWWSGDRHADDLVGPNNGELINGLSFAPGMVGEAFQFDGIDDFVRVANHPSLNFTRAMTVECWAKWELPGAWENIVCKVDVPTNDRSYTLQKGNKDVINFYLTSSRPMDLARASISVSTPTQLLPGRWYHLAATYDSRAELLFVNGKLEAAKRADPERSIRHSAADLLIGAGHGPQGHDCHFRGQIDEVSLYDRALTESEIQAIYRASAAGKIKPQPNVIKSSPAVEYRPQIEESRIEPEATR